jgi:RHS repeat-associated protein
VPGSYPFTFTGRVPLVGNVVYFRNRYYDSATGRFLSEDPLDFNGGDTDLYRYASGNPASETDPLGLRAEPQFEAEPPPYKTTTICRAAWNLYSASGDLVNGTGKVLAGGFALVFFKNPLGIILIYWGLHDINGALQSISDAKNIAQAEAARAAANSLQRTRLIQGLYPSPVPNSPTPR